MSRALISLVVLALTSSCADDRGPRLISVAPNVAQRGWQVVLTGERLCGEQGDCATAGGQIQLGLELPTVHANIIDYADDHATVEIPGVAEVGSTEIFVTVNDRTSNALELVVLAP